MVRRWEDVVLKTEPVEIVLHFAYILQDDERSCGVLTFVIIVIMWNFLSFQGSREITVLLRGISNGFTDLVVSF
jgi:uncharacterized protein Smg (DUF494 family)